MNENTKDITKGDFGELSFGGLAFQNKEGKTEMRLRHAVDLSFIDMNGYKWL